MHEALRSWRGAVAGRAEVVAESLGGLGRPAGDWPLAALRLCSVHDRDTSDSGSRASASLRRLSRSSARSAADAEERLLAHPDALSQCALPAAVGDASALAPLAVGDARALMRCGPSLLFWCPRILEKTKSEAGERDDRRAETDSSEGPQRSADRADPGRGPAGLGRDRGWGWRGGWRHDVICTQELDYRLFSRQGGPAPDSEFTGRGGSRRWSKRDTRNPRAHPGSTAGRRRTARRTAPTPTWSGGTRPCRATSSGG